MADDSTVSLPVVKAVSAWAAVGGISIADLANYTTVVASILASIYSAILITEWLWKKFRKGVPPCPQSPPK